MNNNANAITALDPSDSTYYLNPDFDEDEVNAKQNISVKYEQLAAETNEVKVYTHRNTNKDYYLIDGSLYSNYFDFSTKIGTVYYLTVSITATKEISGNTYKFKYAGTDITSTTTLTVSNINSLTVTYNKKGGGTGTLYYRNGKLYTNSSRTTLYTGAYVLNDPYISYVTSPAVTF